MNYLIYYGPTKKFLRKKRDCILEDQIDKEFSSEKDDEMEGVLANLTEVELTLLRFALQRLYIYIYIYIYIFFLDFFLYPQSISSLQFDTIYVNELTHGNALIVVAFILFQR
jgi:hypothetical protein